MTFKLVARPTAATPSPSPRPASRSRATRRAPAPEPLGGLLRDPSLAHRSWDRMSEARRQLVLVELRKLHGEAWTEEFELRHAARDLRLDLVFAYGGHGPPAAQLADEGFVLASATPVSGGRVERWIHPDGSMAQMVRSEQPGSESSTAPGSTSSTAPGSTAASPGTRAPITTDFGVEINSATIEAPRDDIPYFIGTGHAIQYRNAEGVITILVYRDGSDAPKIWQSSDGEVFQSYGEGGALVSPTVDPAELRALFDPADAIDAP